LDRGASTSARAHEYSGRGVGGAGVLSAAGGGGGGRRLTQDFRGDRERPELVDLDICKSMSEIDPAADESVPV